jgi:hypothetical protein
MENKRGQGLIFVGGAPRSGTSLVQKILDLHPEIYAGPEFDHLPAIIHLYERMKEGVENGRQVFYYNDESIKEHFSFFIEKLLLQKKEKEGVKMLSEKTPANVLVFDKLKAFFPKAKFLFIVRDPRAIINSMKTVAERGRESGISVSVGNDLLQDLMIVHKYLKAGDSFFRKNTNDCYCLYYESLVREPENEIKRICSFLGVKFHPRMLETDKKTDGSELIEQGNETVKAWYTKDMYDRPINESSVDNWKSRLEKKDVYFIDSFFSNKEVSCLDKYLITKPSMGEKITIGRLYLKYYGPFFIVNSLINKVFAKGKKN